MAVPMLGGEGEERFGDWLRGHLRAMGSTPAHLARHLGVTTVQVNAWLAGRATPTPEQCARLASLLGVPARQVRRRAGIVALRAAEAAGEPARPRVAGVAAAREPVVSPMVAPLAVPGDIPAASSPIAASVAAVPSTPVPAGAERPARRRPQARRARAAPPPPPEPAVARLPADVARQVATFRALADEVEGAGEASATLGAAVERLRVACARLAAENARLQAQIDEVRAALGGDDARPRP